MRLRSRRRFVRLELFFCTTPTRHRHHHQPLIQSEPDALPTSSLGTSPPLIFASRQPPTMLSLGLAQIIPRCIDPRHKGSQVPFLRDYVRFLTVRSFCTLVSLDSAHHSGWAEANGTFCRRDIEKTEFWMFEILDTGLSLAEENILAAYPTELAYPP